MASAFECRAEPEHEDLVRQSGRDNAAADGEDVGVVVLAREPRRVEIVAERGAHAGNFVGGDLLALSASAEDDAPIGRAASDRAADADADGRVVHRGLAVGAVIVHRVAEASQRLFEMFFEEKARMIRANRNSHDEGLYYEGFMPLTVTISPRGENRLRSGHPWIYRADVTQAGASGGDRVLVRSTRGQTLGSAFYSDRSQIALRMLTRGEAPADDALIRKRIEAALAFRRTLAIDATAYRVIHGEADLLPSLVVDRYGDYLVVQTLSQGSDKLLPVIVAALQDILRPKGILARNDPRTRALEGLEQRVEVLAGDVPEAIEVAENGVQYDVDVRRGQKTGLFLDQRENRAAAAQYAHGRMLDCFTYNGGFALAVAAKCDEVIAFDVSEDAITHVKKNAAANGVTIDARVGNVFDELRGLDRTGQRFDTIVLDPPAFAKNKAAVTNAHAGYKEINLRALKLLNPGGFLVTCSCSYNVNEAMFAELLHEAAVDAMAGVTVVEKRMQGRDHPVLLGVPETYYLKCFVLRKL